MSTRTIEFFATRSDLLPVLDSLTAELDCCFVRTGDVHQQGPESWEAVQSIPWLGEAQSGRQEQNLAILPSGAEVDLAV
ncbi:MAG: hypothetical protein ACI841_004650 [Planctomycetota bacterium]|jgi:hypothetical protein